MDCQPRRQWTGAQAVSVQSLQRRSAHVPVCKFVFCSRQPCKVWDRVSSKVSGTMYCQPRRHWIGTQLVSVQSLRKRSAQRGSGSEESSEEGENMAAQDKLEVKLDDNMEQSVDELVKVKEDLSERSWFLRGWWPSRSQSEIDNITDDKGKEELEKLGNNSVEEAQGSEHNVSEIKSQREGAEIRDSEENGGGDRGEEVAPAEKAVQTEEENVGLWRRFWKQEERVDEDPLGPEEELLLQDLENLTFDWKALLDPTLENLVALGFTALLTLALLKIFWQLLVVVITIALSALKYTVLAAFVVGLLIFFL